jgi:hypothetical protein
MPGQGIPLGNIQAALRPLSHQRVTGIVFFRTTEAVLANASNNAQPCWMVPFAGCFTTTSRMGETCAFLHYADNISSLFDRSFCASPASEPEDWSRAILTGTKAFA